MSEEDVRNREFRYDIPRTLRFFCFGAGISELSSSEAQGYK